MITNYLNHISRRIFKSTKVILPFAFLLLASFPLQTALGRNPKSHIIQFVFISDSHYGTKRAAFRGATDVESNVVNTAMVAKVNTLSTLTFPNDNGIKGGKVVGGIDYVINAGDIANRQESSSKIQSATASWMEFTTSFLNGITLKNNNNQNTEILLLPGNHDISNAIGHYKTLSPLKDNGSMVGIYNYMFPAAKKTIESFDYPKDKIHYSKDFSGLHLVFINMWPDSTERIWIANDLKRVNRSTPVILFAHDEPAVESKHFTNPNGTHTINGTDKFENIIPEVFKDGTTISTPSIIEQRGLVSFLKKYPNIKAYFHGNEHENIFYEYKGPDNDYSIRTFEVDSPMKGNISSSDETKLSFQLVTIDTDTKTMTVRECLWNSNPINPLSPVAWGASITISL
jgi:hypothetical protein